MRDRQTLGCLGSGLSGALSTNFALYLICQPYYSSFILNPTKYAYISIQLKNLRKMEELMKRHMLLISEFSNYVLSK